MELRAREQMVSSNVSQSWVQSTRSTSEHHFGAIEWVQSYTIRQKLFQISVYLWISPTCLIENGQFNGGGKEDVDVDVPILIHYPNNLCYRDILYFLLAPTLCYELNFPRTTRVRKRFLLKRLLEVVFGVNVVMALFQQWIIPSVKNSLVPFSNMEIGLATERLLKLAVTNLAVSFCLFLNNSIFFSITLFL